MRKIFAALLTLSAPVCAFAQDAAEKVDSTMSSLLPPNGEALTSFSHFFEDTFKAFSPDYWQWLLFAAGLVAAFILYFVVKARLLAVASWTPKSAAAPLRKAWCTAFSKPMAYFFSGIAVYISVASILYEQHQTLGEWWTKLFIVYLFALVCIACCRTVNNVTNMIDEHHRQNNQPVDKMLLIIVGKCIKVVIVVLLALVAGDQLGLNVTALIAGAGVAGLAVAFAAQDTIANVFGSLTVVADRPFNVGDYVKIDGIEGTIVSIGFRTTRLKNLDGHLITIPNKSCAGSIIVNVSRRENLRYIFDLGLVYETAPEKLQEAIAILNDIFQKAPGYQKDFAPRIGFSAFKDFSLNISICAFYFTTDEKGKVLPPDFVAFGGWCSAVNLEILKRFNAAGLSFAYPTQVSYLGNVNAELKVVKKDA